MTHNLLFHLVLQLGSYFGSVICAADVNGDKLDDVIIGAPLYSTNTTEEGRVYVYLNKGSVSDRFVSKMINSMILFTTGYTFYGSQAVVTRMFYIQIVS